jgi:predicted nucleic acid-binding protein
VLDSEGLAKAVLRAREVTQWLALALADDLRVITSAATVVEVAHPRLSRPALEWTLSRVVVEPVTEPIARRATAILAEAGLHGHRHAIDAMLSATALVAVGPVTVLTSDPEDIATLCGRNVTVIKVLRDGPGAKRAGSAATRPIGTPCPRLWQAFPRGHRERPHLGRPRRGRQHRDRLTACVPSGSAIAEARKCRPSDITAR